MSEVRTYEFTVLTAWVPRRPDMQKTMHPEMKVQGVNPCDAAIKGLEQALGRPIDWRGCDTTKLDLSDQMDQYDDTWIEVYYGTIEVGSGGFFQLASWSDAYDADHPRDDEEDDED